MILAAYDSDGLPTPGLTPAWAVCLDTSSGSAMAVEPAFDDLGSGLYLVDVPDDVAGIVDFGAASAPRYVLIGSEQRLVVAAFDSSGAPLAGQTPTWNRWLNADTGASETPPVVVELSGGLYRVDDAPQSCAGILDFGPTAVPRYFFIEGAGAKEAGTSLRLAELREAVRQRADIVHSEHVTDDELDGYINASLFELYDLLIQSYGEDYFVDSVSFATNGTSDAYFLGKKIYKLLGVDLRMHGDWVTLRPFSFADRNRSHVARRVGPVCFEYRLRGNSLWFSPTPTGVHEVRVWFIPRMAPLADDNDVMDGISGWLEYVVVDAAIKCLQKEESDVSALFAQKSALKSRIESAAANRDAGMPATVVDASSRTWLRDGWGEEWP